MLPSFQALRKLSGDKIDKQVCDSKHSIDCRIQEAHKRLDQEKLPESVQKQRAESVAPERRRRRAKLKWSEHLIVVVVILLSSDLTLSTFSTATEATQEQPSNGSAQQQSASKQRPRRPPAGSKCLLPPFFAPLPSQAQAQRQQQKPVEAALSSSNATLGYLNSLHLRLWLKDTHSGGVGGVGGTGALGSRGAPSGHFFHVPASNNSLRLFAKDPSGSPSLVNGSQVAAASPMVAFQSICSIWHNSLRPERRQLQPAYWVLDRRRGALVARFDYYDRGEFYDVLGHEAKLTSAPFHPIPPYHFQPESRYYKSCKISFRSYMTLRASLELNFVSVATVATSGGNSAAAQQLSLKAAGGQQRQQTGDRGHKMVKTNSIQQESKQFWLSNKHNSSDAERSGEEAAWRDHLVELPNDDLAQRRVPYMLEFSAMPSVVRQDSLQQQSYLNGVAIANFSLSPQCFGLEVDEAEWARLREAGEPVDQYLGAASESLQPEQRLSGETIGGDGNELDSLRFPLVSLGNLQFIEQHKTSILIGVIFVLVAVLVASQWLLCTHLQCNNPAAASGQWPGSVQKPKSILEWLWWKLLDLLGQFLHCCCCCCSCCCASGKACTIGRHRVYGAGEQNGAERCSKLADQSKQHHHHQLLGVDSHEQHRIQNNYLRPISASIFEDVELNENPNYIADNRTERLRRQGSSLAAASHQQLTLKLAANNPLEPYYIDRKRLTLTNPLGKGAFGEVYQGYLVCHCSDDGKTLLRNQQEDDSLESHSLKVAVKTLTDERMSEIDFVREAINMSLVAHRNIVELLGVCFDEKPLYIVMELMPGGNLKNFLLKNRHRGHHFNGRAAAQAQQEERVELCMGDLLVYALDIARACDYLQKRQFIHRDLAARNCLLSACSRAAPAAANQQQQLPTNYIQAHAVFPNSLHNQSTASSSAPLIPNEQHQAVSAWPRAPGNPRTSAASPPSALEVKANHRVDLEQVYLNGYQDSSIVAKLADFGMTRDVYSNDYYRMGHKELPVRWMPPECLDGVATTKSDVWSFSVFLWELFSMGQLPYQHLLDNHQVIEFIRSRRHAKAPKCSERQPPPETEREASEAEGQQQGLPLLGAASEAGDGPPLPPPHDNTPHPIYSIMCACWATNPEERPQFEEIANRLYWCLQMPDVLATSLPCFYEQHTPNDSQAATGLQQNKAYKQPQQMPKGAQLEASSPNPAVSQCDTVVEGQREERQLIEGIDDVPAVATATKADLLPIAPSRIVENGDQCQQFLVDSQSEAWWLQGSVECEEGGRSSGEGGHGG